MYTKLKAENYRRGSGKPYDRGAGIREEKWTERNVTGKEGCGGSGNSDIPPK
jgi:hypothetical protein